MITFYSPDDDNILQNGDKLLRKCYTLIYMYCTSKYLIIVLEAEKKNNVLNMINPENQDLIKNKQCSYCGEWLYIDLRQ